MTSNAKTVDEYLNSVPAERKEAVTRLRDTINNNLPDGFAEIMQYGMPCYVVPHSIYPAGYHCTPELPLPFLSFASQKNFIAFYNMLIYSDEAIYDWFTAEYANQVKGKIDMGKSCVRFKKPAEIPFNLIGELVKKVTPQQWVEIYEKNYKSLLKT